jgi:O-antigen ligase
VPFLLLAALALAIRTVKLKRTVVIGLICLAMVVSWGLFRTDTVQTRIHKFQYDLSQLEKFDPANAIEVRLLMWGQAWLEICQAPLLGTGFSGYRERVRAEIQSGDLPDYMMSYATEPHNEYLYQWATRGGIGLIVYLSLLAGVGLYFFKWLFFGGPSQVLVGYTGLCLVIVVAVGGLTITVIDQRDVIRFLGWISAFLIYCVWLCKEKNLSENMICKK